MPLNFQFEGGRKLVRELNADRLNRILDEIRRAKPLPGRGITTTQESNGVRVDALNAGGGSASSASAHPFRVIVRSSQGSSFVGVEPISYVYAGLPAGGPIIPSGVLTDASDLEDPGWQTASGIKYIWLEYDIEAGTSVQFGGEEEFDPYAIAFDEEAPGILEATTEDPNFPVFAKARKIIAEISETDGKVSVSQYMKAHQLAQDVVVNGIPANYWFDVVAGPPPQPPQE